MANIFCNTPWLTGHRTIASLTLHQGRLRPPEGRRSSGFKRHRLGRDAELAPPSRPTRHLYVSLAQDHLGTHNPEDTRVANLLGRNPGVSYRLGVGEFFSSKLVRPQYLNIAVEAADGGIDSVEHRAMIAEPATPRTETTLVRLSIVRAQYIFDFF
jgi:hypothetical protein